MSCRPLPTDYVNAYNTKPDTLSAARDKLKGALAGVPVMRGKRMGLDVTTMQRKLQNEDVENVFAFEDWQGIIFKDLTGESIAAILFQPNSDGDPNSRATKRALRFNGAIAKFTPSFPVLGSFIPPASELVPGLENL